jgi:hypothetical protein
MSFRREALNSLTGLACLGGTVGIYWWSIYAVQQVSLCRGRMNVNAGSNTKTDVLQDDFMNLGDDKVYVAQSGLKVLNKESGCVSILFG